MGLRAAHSAWTGLLVALAILMCFVMPGGKCMDELNIELLTNM